MSRSLFLGRADSIEKLEREVFSVPVGCFGDCLSICGPHGIGKTYLIDHMRGMFEQRVSLLEFPKEYCFYLEIVTKGTQTLVDFQNDLLARLAGELTEDLLEEAVEQQRENPVAYRSAKKSMKNLLAAYQLPNQQPNRGSEGYENWCSRIDRSMQSDGTSSVFRNYTNLGFRIILILDEFDRAAREYPSGDIFHWLFSLSNKSSTGSRLNLSTVLISRRRPNQIAHHMEDGSNFEDAYPPHALRGFNNQELDEYFKSFEGFACSVPTQKMRQQILYLCGRHPGLLMRMRAEISKDTAAEPNVNVIWRNNTGLFKTVYEKMCTQMQNERISVSTNTTLMDALLYQFEFFATEEDSHYDERLVNTGYATKTVEEEPVVDSETGIKYYPDIFTLSGVKDVEDAVELLKCEPLSPYFLEYVRRNWNPDVQKGAAAQLELTERALRKFIEEKLKFRYGSEWKTAAEDGIKKKGTKIRFLTRLQDMADLNGYDGDLSILDVLSFENYASIITKNWEGLFDCCFRSFICADMGCLEKLTTEMDFLKSCRDTSAHCNIKVLNTEYLAHLKDVCDRLNRDISNEYAMILTGTDSR